MHQSCIFEGKCKKKCSKYKSLALIFELRPDLMHTACMDCATGLHRTMQFARIDIRPPMEVSCIGQLASFSYIAFLAGMKCNESCNGFALFILDMGRLGSWPGRGLRAPADSGRAWMDACSFEPPGGAVPSGGAVPPGGAVAATRLHTCAERYPVSRRGQGKVVRAPRSKSRIPKPGSHPVPQSAVL